SGSFITLIYELSKKNNLKILYATIALTFAINLFIDGDVMRPIKNATSLKGFTERIQTEYPLKDNLYTANNLLRYQNIYALNFYSGNELKNIAIESPEKGYFIIGKNDFEKIRKDFPEYQFSAIDSSPHPFNEIKQTVVLYQFTKQH
ncbi:MAG: ArnT family glycosyltransferase, partial [Tannerellaceae bacterium]